MIKAYKYRIYPSRAQVTALERTLGVCCELYNAALQERREAWRIAHKSVDYIHQQNQLPEIKAICPELGMIHSRVLQDVLIRLQKAFDAFFRRVAENKKLPKEKRQPVGYPRFRPRSRYDSITYRQEGFAIEQDKLRLSKIGKVKIKLHRPVEGKIKTLTITRNATGKWFACFAVECESEPLPATIEATGVDMGLKEFAVLSNGKPIHNPRFFRTEEKRIARAQRKRDAAAKGSPERRKLGKIVAHIHEGIASKRKDFAHKESRKLVESYGFIAFEKLNIGGMLKNHCLAKSIADAAWGQFVRFTTYKAECAGRRVVQINPCNTSQMCSGCGEIVKKDLSVRIHACSSCGLTLDRDHNAALNILTLGLQSPGVPRAQTKKAASFFRKRSSHEPVTEPSPAYCSYIGDLISIRDLVKLGVSEATIYRKTKRDGKWKWTLGPSPGVMGLRRPKLIVISSLPPHLQLACMKRAKASAIG